LAGQANDAVAEHHRALQDDPLNLIIRVGLVLSLTSAGRHREASEEAHRLLELAPEFGASYALQVLNVVTEPPAVALAFAERLHALSPWAAGSVGLFAGLLHRAGDVARASALIQPFNNMAEYGNAVDLALYHLGSGETERAFDVMPALVEQHHPLLIMVLVGGSYGDVLRASPRWPAFARTIGLG
jgi:hypothetical protein